MVKLAEEHNSSEVIGVVGGEAFELLANSHDARGLACGRGAADGLVKA